MACYEYGGCSAVPISKVEASGNTITFYKADSCQQSNPPCSFSPVGVITLTAGSASGTAEAGALCVEYGGCSPLAITKVEASGNTITFYKADSCQQSNPPCSFSPVGEITFTEGSIYGTAEAGALCVEYGGCSALPITKVEATGNAITFYRTDWCQQGDVDCHYTSLGTFPDHAEYVGDFNGDGKTDFVDIYNGNARVWLSNGSGFYDAGVWAYGVDTNVSAFRVADMNGDGKSDLVRVISGGGTFDVWLSQGTNFAYTGTWASGIDNSNDLQFVDVNGDGMTDIIWFTPYNMYVGISSGSNFASYTALNRGPEDTRVLKVADVNGDGKADILMFAYSSVYVSLSTGTTFTDFALWATGVDDYYGDDYDTPASLFTTLADVNGDGKADIVRFVPQEGTRVWLSASGCYSANSGCFLYTGPWTYAHSMEGPKHVIDLKGNGKPSIVQIESNGTAFVAPSLRVPDVLTTVTNPLGGATTFTYEPSSSYANTRLPFVLETVRWINSADGLGNNYSTYFDYSGGYYDYGDREFRGFGTAVTYPGGNDYWQAYSYTVFNQGIGGQSPALKGTVNYQGTVARSQGHSTQVMNHYSPYSVGGSLFPNLYQSETTVTDNWNQSYTVTSSMEYDGYLNVTHERKYDNTTTEEINTYTTYNTRQDLIDQWMLSKPADVRVEGAAGAIASRKWMDYDGKGNVVTEEVCKSDTPGTGCVNRDANNNVVTTFQYNPDGTLLKAADPRLFETRFTYDPTATYVASKTGCIDAACTASLTTTTEYDTRYGKVTRTVPPYLQGTGLAVTAGYDAFGRPSWEVRPDGGQTSYSYVIGNASNQYVAKQEHIVYEGTSTDHLSYEWIDGLGRSYRSAVTAPAGASSTGYIYTSTQFDNYGRVWKKYNPGFDAPSTYFIQSGYDELSRVVRITKPDGTYATTEYHGLTRRVTDERTHTTVSESDGFGRLRRVTDAKGTKTDYTYDTAGNPISVLADTDNVSGLRNTTSITYNSLGKKIAMTDPDMGHWTYAYDKSGNLISQTDSKTQPQTITFTYDGLNRMTSKIYPDGHAVTYTYDAAPAGVTVVCPASVPNCTLGKLIQVYDPSGDAKTDTVLALDVMQRAIKSRKSIGTSTKDIGKTYDSAGRTIRVVYFPGTAEQKTYQYTYDLAGNLKSLDKVPESGPATTIAAFSDFTPSGQHGNAVYPKGSGAEVRTHYTYDPAMARLTHLVSEKVQGSTTTPYQDLSYAFDPRGNIDSKTDNLAGVTHTYAYDELDRLTSVTGSGSIAYSQSYDYDALGNIKCKSDVGSYTYWPNKPHAVKTAGSIGSEADPIVYDANGNMIHRPVVGGDTLDIQYNADNKPVAIFKNSGQNAYVTYEYDGNGQRVKKSGPATTTLYFGEAYEERTTAGGVAVGIIHLFAGSQRVVSIRAGTDNNEQWYLSDHLGSASIVTDQNGDVKEKMDYFPYGTYRERSDYSADFPDVNYTFTDQEEDDEVGLYNYGARLYDPVLGRFISADSMVPDPGNLQALNRYSYCGNNPLIYTDPSGHNPVLIAMAISAAMGALTAGMQSDWNLQAMGVGAAIGAVSAMAGAAAGAAAGAVFANEFLAGAVAGAVGGATGGAINAAYYGGNVGTGAIMGGAFGAVCGAIGGAAAYQEADIARASVEGALLRSAWYDGQNHPQINVTSDQLKLISTGFGSNSDGWAVFLAKRPLEGLEHKYLWARHEYIVIVAPDGTAFDFGFAPVKASAALKNLQGVVHGPGYEDFSKAVFTHMVGVDAPKLLAECFKSVGSAPRYLLGVSDCQTWAYDMLTKATPKWYHQIHNYPRPPHTML